MRLCKIKKSFELVGWNNKLIKENDITFFNSGASDESANNVADHKSASIIITFRRLLSSCHKMPEEFVEKDLYKICLSSLSIPASHRCC